jgi:hypothetical protein
MPTLTNKSRHPQLIGDVKTLKSGIQGIYPLLTNVKFS